MPRDQVLRSEYSRQVQVLDVEATVASRETPETGAKDLRNPETGFLASASDFTISEVPFSIKEIAQMAA
jgi:hypothetical protein